MPPAAALMNSGPGFGRIYSWFMLDATRLRVLVAVARYGSVTGAAQALNYAQPSISHHIARLEAETGAKLMERSGRGVKLTEAGQLLADRAEEIIGRLDAAEAELATHVGLRQDRVRLAAFGSALSTLVATASAALHANHADSGVQLVQAEPTEALRMLRAGEVDVALVYRLLRDGKTFDPPTAEPRTSFADAYPDAQPVLEDSIFLITAQPSTEPGGASTEPITDPQSDLVAHDQPPDLPAARAAILAAHSGERWISASEQCDELLLDLCRDARFGRCGLAHPRFRCGAVPGRHAASASRSCRAWPCARPPSRNPGDRCQVLAVQILAVTYESASDSPAARA